MSLPPQLRKITDNIWELPVTYKEGMRVPARSTFTVKIGLRVQTRIWSKARRSGSPVVMD